MTSFDLIESDKFFFFFSSSLIDRRRERWLSPHSPLSTHCPFDKEKETQWSPLTNGFFLAPSLFAFDLEISRTSRSSTSTRSKLMTQVDDNTSNNWHFSSYFVDYSSVDLYKSIDDYIKEKKTSRLSSCHRLSENACPSTDQRRGKRSIDEIFLQFSTSWRSNRLICIQLIEFHLSKMRFLFFVFVIVIVVDEVSVLAPMSVEISNAEVN